MFVRVNYMLTTCNLFIWVWGALLTGQTSSSVHLIIIITMIKQKKTHKLRETKNKRSFELEDTNSFTHPFTSRNFTWEMVLAQWKPWLWLWNSMRQIGHCENHFINCLKDIKNALFQFDSYRIVSVESLFVRLIVNASDTEARVRVLFTAIFIISEIERYQQ